MKSRKPPPLGSPMISDDFDDTMDELNSLALVFSMKGSDKFSIRLDRLTRPMVTLPPTGAGTTFVHTSTSAIGSVIKSKIGYCLRHGISNDVAIAFRIADVSLLGRWTVIFTRTQSSNESCLFVERHAH